MVSIQQAANYQPPPGRTYAGTPRRWFNQLNKEFDLDLDVAADDRWHMCDQYFTQEDNALDRSWEGRRCWMAPPWAKGVLDYWIMKALREVNEGDATVLALLPARTNTSWWHNWVIKYASEIRFIDGNLPWVDIQTGSPFKESLKVEPACLVLWRPQFRRHLPYRPAVSSYPARLRRKR